MQGAPLLWDVILVGHSNSLPLEIGPDLKQDVLAEIWRSKVKP